jgi:hypothetical protein
MNKQHGGARQNAGRKTETPEVRMVSFSVSIDLASAERLRVLGGGNRSFGLRKLLAEKGIK